MNSGRVKVSTNASSHVRIIAIDEALLAIDSMKSRDKYLVGVAIGRPRWPRQMAMLLCLRRRASRSDGVPAANGGVAFGAFSLRRHFGCGRARGLLGRCGPCEQQGLIVGLRARWAQYLKSGRCDLPVLLPDDGDTTVQDWNKDHGQ